MTIPEPSAEQRAESEPATRIYPLASEFARPRCHAVNCRFKKVQT
jgi:hypothetical protein